MLCSRLFSGIRCTRPGGTTERKKNMKKKNKTAAEKIAVLGLLSALTAVTAFIPLRTLGLEITLCTVPVAVAAALYGPFTGAFCGAVFGTVSFIQCFGYSPFGVMMMNVSPLRAFLTCVPTRIAAGFIAGALARLILRRAEKRGKGTGLCCTAASVAVPVLNTLLFMTVLCLCFYNCEFIRTFAEMLNAKNALSFAVLFVGINGAAEIAAGIIIALPVSRALTAVLFGKKSKTETGDFDI